MKATVLLASGLPALAASKIIDFTPRLISYNIRWAVPIVLPPEPAWSDRLPSLASQLFHETAGRPTSLICLQEVLATQLADIKSALGTPTWSSVGVGRDDGAEGGEFSPILFRPDAYELLNSSTRWLSPTPEEPGSKGWDAALPRVVTTATLRDRRSGAPLTYMCTHFDHIGQTARVESAKLLVRFAEEAAVVVDGEETPVFLGGDLNITPENPAYLEMVAEGNYHDAKDVVDPRRIHGHLNTFTGFSDDRSGWSRIDHVFVWRPEVQGMALLNYGVLENKFDDNLWISDHRPVIVDVNFAINKTCVERS
ncbi:hypothetical protein D7B24_000448 [Verticillium nonalfalfae]|uniref:Endonuclease/exonuclease/phosphatase domain-containing protein n=1 Tax=Verticillium nonalfalfae TaxID=1051616 RepID=A0A3M9Y2X9_9PEZI|nr:uncharacterized protein D7B24_000448 [Verticillium nonalfalfae]RNJ54475.1 hypothetical protein D7B24_000448 [Verticillium nonalfalfae]